MAKALFVTGTGTDVGKTYVTALMVKKLAESGENAAYYKAAMSGNRRRSDGSLIPGDAMFVQQTAGLSQPLGEMCPYVYEHAWSPHLAARYEGNPPELPVIRQGFEAVCSRNDYVTVEGSGGILCPLRAENGKTLWLEDVIRALQLPSVIIADAGLGTINSVVLTAEYMQGKKLPVRESSLITFIAATRWKRTTSPCADSARACPCSPAFPTAHRNFRWNQPI